MRNYSPILALLILSLLASLLAACGQKGPLRLPPAPAQTQSQASPQAPSPATAAPAASPAAPAKPATPDQPR